MAAHGRTAPCLCDLDQFTCAGGLSTAGRQHLHLQKRCTLICEAASLQFVKGVEEPSVPDVKLTRSKDGSSGTATFVFDQPSIFEASSELGDITGGLLIALLLRRL